MRTYTLKAEYAVVGVNPTTSTNTAVTLVVRRHVKKSSDVMALRGAAVDLQASHLMNELRSYGSEREV
jgi:hypothetical protein